MKKTYYIIWALLLLLFSCEEHKIETIRDIASVRINVSDFSDGDITNHTRSSLYPGNNGTSFSWMPGDVASVYSSENGLTNFFIDESSISSNGNSALFRGSGFSLVPNSFYYGFFPYLSSALDKGKIPVTFCGQNIDRNGGFEGLNLFDYMWSRGSTNSEGNVGFDFSHLGCVVEMKLEVPATACYTEVRLEIDKNSDSLSLIKNGYVDITSAEPHITPRTGELSDSIVRLSLNHGDGITVNEDSLLVLYIMMAPQDLSSKNVTIRLLDKNRNWYTAKTVGKNMKAGYTYHYYIGKNSAQGGFEGSGTGMPDDYSYRLISKYIEPSGGSYEDILVDGSSIYSIGYFGVRKLDFSNEENPILITNNTNIVNNNTRARALLSNNEYLYVNVRQNTWGENEIWKPRVRYNFERGIKEFAEVQLSNHPVINAFFKVLRVNRDIIKIKSVTIYKAFERSDGFRNAIVMRVNGEKDIVFLGKTYLNRAEALDALEGYYKNADGDYCEVDWNQISEGAHDLTNLTFNYIKKVFVSQMTNTSIDSLGQPSPNQGFHSGRFMTGDITTTSQVTLRTTISECKEGWFSFWINIPSLFSQVIKCPLTYNNATCLYRINMIPTEGGYYISNNGTSHKKVFSVGEWYNIKIHVHSSGSELYYREADCTEWIPIETNSIYNPPFNTISVGLSTNTPNTMMYIDDYYFDETDIDKVSYVNGKVYILDKTDLSIKNTINLDYRATGIAIKNNILIVSGLYNVKFYDISIPLKPRHLYTYQPTFERDMQDVCTYDYGGHSYAIVCCYSSGFMIWDITNRDNIKLICDEDFKDIIINGLYIKGKLNCFSCVVDYPYVYMTLSPLPAYASRFKTLSGIMVLNIQDISNITREFVFIPVSDITNTNAISGDPAPIKIAKYNNTLYLNNREKGISIFDTNNHIPVYRQSLKIGNSIYPITIAPDGRMFLGDDRNFEGEKNLYLLRIE